MDRRVIKVRPAVSGRHAIQQFWQGVMGMGVREVDLQTQEAQASGDLAYEIGSATLKMSADGKLAAIVTADGTITIFDVATGKEMMKFSGKK